MPLSIISIARNSIKFTTVKTIAALAGLGVALYAATILLPEEYGTYGLLSLWLTYVGLVTPGIYNAASREMPVLLGKGQEKDALRVQNISISAELIFTIAPAAAIIAAAFFYTDTVMRYGLLIIAMSYIATRVSGIWSSMNFIRERFNTVALGNIIMAIVSPAVILVSLHWLKVYALIIGPLASYIVLVIFYLTKGPLGFRFTLDRHEIIRLTKVGIILQGLTVVFLAFRIADRTIIAATLSREQLGLYVFAVGFLTYALSIFEDFSRVLQPVLWRHAGTAESIFTGFKDTRRIAVYLALGTAIVIPLAQLAFVLIAALIAKKYVDSIPIFNVLSYNLYLTAIATIPSLILNSSLVNKQRLALFFYAIGLAISIGLDLLVVRLGYGVIGIAWVTIGTQGLVTLILYYLIKNYVFKTAAEFRKSAIIIVIPFLASLPFYFIHAYLYSATTSLWAFTGISLAAQAAVWTLIIVIFYRDYVSATEFRVLMREIRAVIPGSRRDDSNPMG
jgi:O-antigen/teichoic acid export membrane protein